MGNTAFTEKIPEYLRPYIARQDPSLYTAIDHASWRYILKISQAYFGKHAHQKYLDGLRQTGISTERIPLIEEMNQCLRKFNWQAVPVTGFIPPAVFMEFLSLGVLPIACDMRNIEHLAYTPAPDIVHEAAGHAPIIADSEYADYLRSYGEISQKAIFSRQDMEVYHAIRDLSDTKENPHATPNEIQQAELKLEQAIEAQTEESEATLLSRMGWWTFEYGLVGDMAQPKIYGAGLLSSLGESYHCFDSKVKKIPFSIHCIETSYDITRPQPQLFVAPSFHVLKEGLEDLANQMAFRRGGVEGLVKARKAEAVTTVVLDSGIQVSGVLKDFLTTSSGKPCYLFYSGPTQISYQDQELEGQGADYHSQGFGTPVEEVTEELLSKFHLEKGKQGRLEFESGIHVEGKLVRILKHDNHLVLLTFEGCTVTRGTEVLFRPEWGLYDMICGKKVVSVFGGAADRKRYLDATGGFHQEPGHQKTNLTEKNRELNELYGCLRKIREDIAEKKGKSETINQSRWDALVQIYEKLETNYPKDWLLRYELLELNSTYKLNLPIEEALRQKLVEISRESQETAETIRRGLELL